MSRNTFAVVAGSIVAGVIGGATADFILDRLKSPPKPREIRIFTANPHTVDRHVTATWPEIEQAQVDALTAALRRVPESARRRVVIFCGNEVYCGDLALNLENAFESAHWKVDREAPIFDNTVGIGVSDKALAEMLAGATGLTAAVVGAAVGDRVAVSIGRRPKG